MKLATRLPRKRAIVKLFTTGSTIGPLVDSLHNQCLLRYDAAAIELFLPGKDHSSASIFCSSWLIPPLLGLAYVVLGALLPHIVANVLSAGKERKEGHKDQSTINAYSRRPSILINTNNSREQKAELKFKAFSAVLTTALIIKLSSYLQINYADNSNENMRVMAAAALTQWAILGETTIACWILPLS